MLAAVSGARLEEVVGVVLSPKVRINAVPAVVENGDGGVYLQVQLEFDALPPDSEPLKRGHELRGAYQGHSGVERATSTIAGGHSRSAGAAGFISSSAPQ